jgi:FG-GAP repeat
VNDSFGQDVSVSGATLIVGAPDTNTGAGAAYLFSS